MTSSLAKQLYSHRQKTIDGSLASDPLRAAGKGTFLFDQQTAASLDREAIYEIGCAGMAELVQLDPAFGVFLGSIFNHEYVERDRSSLSKAASDALDLEIGRLLVLLSPQFLRTPAHQVIEYLIRIFRVHSHPPNVDSIVLLLIIPYHDTLLAAKLLTSLTLAATPWAFLIPDAKAGTPIPRPVLARVLAADESRLVRLVDSVAAMAVDRGVPACLERAVTVLVADVLQASRQGTDTGAAAIAKSGHALSERVVRSIVGLSKAFSSARYAGGALLATALCVAETLSADIMRSLLLSILSEIGALIGTSKAPHDEDRSAAAPAVASASREAVGDLDAVGQLLRAASIIAGRVIAVLCSDQTLSRLPPIPHNVPDQVDEHGSSRNKAKPASGSSAVAALEALATFASAKVFRNAVSALSWELLFSASSSESPLCLSEGLGLLITLGLSAHCTAELDRGRIWRHGAISWGAGFTLAAQSVSCAFVMSVTVKCLLGLKAKGLTASTSGSAVALLYSGALQALPRAAPVEFTRTIASLVNAFPSEKDASDNVGHLTSVCDLLSGGSSSALGVESVLTSSLLSGDPDRRLAALKVFEAQFGNSADLEDSTAESAISASTDLDTARNIMAFVLLTETDSRVLFDALDIFAALPQLSYVALDIFLESPAALITLLSRCIGSSGAMIAILKLLTPSNNPDSIANSSNTSDESLSVADVSIDTSCSKETPYVLVVFLLVWLVLQSQRAEQVGLTALGSADFSLPMLKGLPSPSSPAASAALKSLIAIVKKPTAPLSGAPSLGGLAKSHTNAVVRLIRTLVATYTDSLQQSDNAHPAAATVAFGVLVTAFLSLSFRPMEMSLHFPVSIACWTYLIASWKTAAAPAALNRIAEMLSLSADEALHPLCFDPSPSALPLRLACVATLTLLHSQSSIVAFPHSAPHSHAPIELKRVYAALSVAVAMKPSIAKNVFSELVDKHVCVSSANLLDDVAALLLAQHPTSTNAPLSWQLPVVDVMLAYLSRNIPATPPSGMHLAALLQGLSSTRSSTHVLALRLLKALGQQSTLAEALALAVLEATAHISRGSLQSDLQSLTLVPAFKSAFSSPNVPVNIFVELFTTVFEAENYALLAILVDSLPHSMFDIVIQWTSFWVAKLEFRPISICAGEEGTESCCIPAFFRSREEMSNTSGMPDASNSFLRYACALIGPYLLQALSTREHAAKEVHHHCSVSDVHRAVCECIIAGECPLTLEYITLTATNALESASGDPLSSRFASAFALPIRWIVSLLEAIAVSDVGIPLALSQFSGKCLSTLAPCVHSEVRRRRAQHYPEVAACTGPLLSIALSHYLQGVSILPSATSTAAPSAGAIAAMVSNPVDFQCADVQRRFLTLSGLAPVSPSESAVALITESSSLSIELLQHASVVPDDLQRGAVSRRVALLRCAGAAGDPRPAFLLIKGLFACMKAGVAYSSIVPLDVIQSIAEGVGALFIQESTAVEDVASLAHLSNAALAAVAPFAPQVVFDVVPIFAATTCEKNHSFGLALDLLRAVLVSMLDNQVVESVNDFRLISSQIPTLVYASCMAAAVLAMVASQDAVAARRAFDKLPALLRIPTFCVVLHMKLGTSKVSASSLFPVNDADAMSETITLFSSESVAIGAEKLTLLSSSAWIRRTLLPVDQGAALIPTCAASLTGGVQSQLLMSIIDCACATVAHSLLRHPPAVQYSELSPDDEKRVTAATTPVADLVRELMMSLSPGGVINLFDNLADTGLRMRGASPRVFKSEGFSVVLLQVLSSIVERVVDKDLVWLEVLPVFLRLFNAAKDSLVDCFQGEENNAKCLKLLRNCLLGLCSAEEKMSSLFARTAASSFGPVVAIMIEIVSTCNVPEEQAELEAALFPLKAHILGSACKTLVHLKRNLKIALSHFNTLVDSMMKVLSEAIAAAVQSEGASGDEFGDSSPADLSGPSYATEQIINGFAVLIGDYLRYFSPHFVRILEVVARATATIPSLRVTCQNVLTLMSSGSPLQLLPACVTAFSDCPSIASEELCDRFFIASLFATVIHGLPDGALLDASTIGFSLGSLFAALLQPDGMLGGATLALVTAYGAKSRETRKRRSAGAPGGAWLTTTPSCRGRLLNSAVAGATDVLHELLCRLPAAAFTPVIQRILSWASEPLSTLGGRKENGEEDNVIDAEAVETHEVLCRVLILLRGLVMATHTLGAVVVPCLRAAMPNIVMLVHTLLVGTADVPCPLADARVGIRVAAIALFDVFAVLMVLFANASANETEPMPVEGSLAAVEILWSGITTLRCDDTIRKDAVAGAPWDTLTQDPVHSADLTALTTELAFGTSRYDGNFAATFTGVAPTNALLGLWRTGARSDLVHRALHYVHPAVVGVTFSFMPRDVDVQLAVQRFFLKAVRNWTEPVGMPSYGYRWFALRFCIAFYEANEPSFLQSNAVAELLPVLCECLEEDAEELKQLARYGKRVIEHLTGTSLDGVV